MMSLEGRIFQGNQGPGKGLNGNSLKKGILSHEIVAKIGNLKTI